MAHRMVHPAEWETLLREMVRAHPRPARPTAFANWLLAHPSGVGARVAQQIEWSRGREPRGPVRSSPVLKLVHLLRGVGGEGGEWRTLDPLTGFEVVVPGLMGIELVRSYLSGGRRKWHFRLTSTGDVNRRW